MGAIAPAPGGPPLFGLQEQLDSRQYQLGIFLREH
jgi:hypothetical protein